MTASPLDLFAYELLISDLTSLIEKGALRAGERVPSVRRLAAQRGVSIPTVLRAYRALEGRRMIRARPRSGYFVLPPRRGISAPPGAGNVADARSISTGDLIMRCIEIIARPNLVPLGTALPDPACLPGAALSRHLLRAMRRAAGRGLVPTASGLEVLREEIARRAVDAGAAITADDIVITCGCAEALALCLRAITRPGDVVAVESPTYFGTLQALEVLGLKALEIPVDPAAGMSLEVLKEALARQRIAAVVVTPNVHNPLGCVMPDARKRELVDLLRAHDIPAIEDQTYSDLHFGPTRPRSLQAFDQTGLVLACGSFSKTLAPTYRVGWAVPRSFRERVLHLKLATTAATTVPPQEAIAGYLASGEFDRCLRRLRRTFQSNVARWSYEIAARFPEGTRLSSPVGGFLLWVQLPEDRDAVALQRRALQEGLSVAPGPAFSASGAFRNFLRVNAGYAWSSEARDALDGLAALIRSGDTERSRRSLDSRDAGAPHRSDAAGSPPALP